MDLDEYLKQWDEDLPVPSVTMGGLGPSYEQALQICMVEVLRFLHVTQPDVNKMFSGQGPEAEQLYKDVQHMMRNHVIISRLRPSGAQVGAAISLAYQIYRRGADSLREDPAFQDRVIMITKSFPSPYDEN